METAGRPKFLENPGVLMPCSLTPAGPPHQAVQRARLGPRSYHDEGSHELVISGLNGTAGALAVYASPAGLPAEDARLASGCWPLYQAGLLTRRVPTKGFPDASYIISPFPKLLGAGNDPSPRSNGLVTVWSQCITDIDLKRYLLQSIGAVRLASTLCYTVAVTSRPLPTNPGVVHAYQLARLQE